MSVVSIRAALETELAAMSPPLLTAHENQEFSPPAADTAYQRAHFLVAEPLNQENNASHTEQGVLQVSLYYPVKAGSSAAATRAELLRTTFPRGRSLPAGGVTVNVSKTPTIMPGFVDGDRFVIPVRIPWHAHII